MEISPKLAKRKFIAKKKHLHKIDKVNVLVSHYSSRSSVEKFCRFLGQKLQSIAVFCCWICRKVTSPWTSNREKWDRFWETISPYSPCNENPEFTGKGILTGTSNQIYINNFVITNFRFIFIGNFKAWRWWWWWYNASNGPRFTWCTEKPECKPRFKPSSVRGARASRRWAWDPAGPTGFQGSLFKIWRERKKI